MSDALPVTAVYSLILPAGDAAGDLGDLVTRATRGQRFRRINRFIQLALIGAHECRHSDRSDWASSQPIVIATGQGNIADTTQMLSSVVGRGQPPMPFQFINLAGNMAGFYLAQSLGVEAANTTVSQLDFPVEAALTVAAEEFRRHGSALLGAVDELAWPLEAHRRRLGAASDQAIGEGSHWLRIGDGEPLGWVESPVYCRDAAETAECIEGLAVSRVVRTPGEAKDTPMHDTLSAGRWCEFLQGAAPGETLGHVSEGADGRCAVVRVTRAD